jgi:L-2-hydroxyglutarate oxidase LhgO
MTTSAPATADVAVVGGGILGLACAAELLRRRPECKVVLLEKEAEVAAHQTSHNSGVVHAGIYYAPGSLKARLCREGVGLLRTYCGARGIPLREAGKLIVASSPADLDRLTVLEDRASRNGVPDVRRLRAEEIAEVEPAAVGVAALHSPHTAIVDYRAITQAMAVELATTGHEVRLGFEVTELRRELGGGVVVCSAEEAFAVDRLVVCAGLQTDRVARLAGDAKGPAIVPFRGEYYRLVPAREHLVRGLIYPVPDPRYPFLGVHFTRRVGGGVDVGPNAVLALAREGYTWGRVRPGEFLATVGWPGMRPLARQHWRMGVREFRGSLSKKAFMAAAREYVPSVTADDVVKAPAGVRAQAVDRDGTLVDDFRIHQVGPVVAVRNAPSPAATSALAIGEHVAERVLAGS